MTRAEYHNFQKLLNKEPEIANQLCKAHTGLTWEERLAKKAQQFCQLSDRFSETSAHLFKATTLVCESMVNQYDLWAREFLNLACTRQRQGVDFHLKLRAFKAFLKLQEK